MNIRSFLLNGTEDLKTRDFIIALLLGIVVPNLAILVATLYTGATRPIINCDYFLPVILFSLGYRIFGLLTLFALFSIDCILITLQFFPFIRLTDLIYLSNFLVIGLSFYKIITTIVFVIIVSKCLLLYQYSHKLLLKPLLLVMTLLTMLAISPILPPSLPLVKSQALYFFQHKDAAFLTLADDGKLLVPIKNSSASQPWFDALHTKQPLSNKVLLIVAESWGQAASAQVQNTVLAQLKSNPARYEYIKEGHFFFAGATVAGELRELCQLTPRSFNLREANAELAACLPYRLKKQGYTTYALHGTNGDLYDRHVWYKRAGFEHITFFGDKPWPKRCFSFSGICDIDLMPELTSAFAKPEKTFFYWMTLNSHIDYEAKDILHDRLDCAAFGINPDTEGCRNLKLHTQFFDSLSETLNKPEMKGVEVIIVGDHPPPVVNLSANIMTFNNSDVSWIHLKVK